MAFVLVLLLTPATARAAITVADSEFAGTDWTTTEVIVTSGATHVEEQVPTDGNPGAFRSITIVAQPTTPDEPGSNATLAHELAAPPIDPATLGGIAAVDFSFDVRMLTAGGMQFGLLVFQDGIPYAPFRNPPDADPERARVPLWISAGRSCLTADELFRFPNGSEHPDFSSGGSPLTFGFHSGGAFSGPGVTYTLTGGIDNFTATVHSAAEGCSSSGIAIDLTDGDHAWETDPVIPYAITVTNDGSTPASGLVVTLKVPASTTFVAATSSEGWSCTSSDEGGICSVSLPDLPAGGDHHLTFAARVKDGTDPRWTVYAVASTNPLDDECTDALSLGCGASCTTLGEGCDDCPHECNGVPVHAGCEGCHDCQVQCGAAVPPETVLRCCYVTVLFALDLICQENASAAAVSAKGATATPPTYSGAVLYRTRDEVFRATPGGRRATELYYRHAGDLIRGGITNPVFNHAYWAFAAWYPHLVALTTEGAPPEAVTSEQVALLTTFLDALRPVASRALGAAIDRGRARLELESWVGLSSTEALGRLDQLVCDVQPTYPSVACRLDDGIALVEDNLAEGALAEKLATTLARARDQATRAGELADAGDARAARRSGRHATRLVRRVVKRTRSRRGRRDIPEAAAARLVELAGAVRADLRRLRRSGASNRAARRGTSTASSSGGVAVGAPAALAGSLLRRLPHVARRARRPQQRRVVRCRLRWRRDHRVALAGPHAGTTALPEPRHRRACRRAGPRGDR